MDENKIAETLVDGMEILIEKKVSDLAFNKTIRGKIAQVIDASIGEYKIQYQNSYFTAYTADSSATYQKGIDVYVEILSNDFEKNAIILGTVQRLGVNYISIVEQLDKYTNIGEELSYDEEISFCSYNPKSPRVLFDVNNQDGQFWKIDEDIVKECAAAADSLKIGLKIKNNLNIEQRGARGNFGLKIIVEYHDEAYVSNGPVLEREYILDVANMSGQPYKYTGYTDQYYIFPIDAKNFIRIKSITAFCEGFVEDQTKEDIDIWFKDFNIQFLEGLKEEELQNTSLKILTPRGFCFSDQQRKNKLLQAELKIKGKPVNLATQKIDFFWHIRDARENSTYGGRGWKQLNSFSPGAYKQEITMDQCAAAETEFKCVACYLVNGESVQFEATIIIKNIEKTDLYIESKTGKIFAFNMGSTTLTLKGYIPSDTAQKIEYCWLESIDGGNAIILESANQASLDVNIKTPSARTLRYVCSVYEDDKLIGSASITLVNNKEALGYTLVINNATQIFKYDVYGKSPASRALAEADRLKIEPLTFDIYDKQGNPIYFPVDKSNFMSFRWLWPDKTLLTTNVELDDEAYSLDVANNETISRKAYYGEKLEFGIADVYNTELANAPDAINNIELEVEYQGEQLRARTNFTFTKEGELGTNGTKYLARIVPREDKKFAEIFIAGNSLYAAQYNNNAESADSVTFVQLVAANEMKNLDDFFEAQLWDGAKQITDIGIKWSLSSSTQRANKNDSKLTISEKDGTIGINSGGTSVYNVIQATITLKDKRDQFGSSLKYYATYPLLYTTSLYNQNELLYIDGGYREVMYESDGTRGRYFGLDFYPRFWGYSGKRKFTDFEIDDWSCSWLDEKIESNETRLYRIEPPFLYDAEKTKNWISLSFKQSTAGDPIITTYLPIEMYLNRYGMAAMNDWDGNSIQINDKDAYILAPQVGAGSKDENNSFTGITIGEVFEANKKEVGLFGYGAGERTIFLDAKTGDATFGRSGAAQIQIRADGEGVIQSGDFKDGGQGLKIKFSSTKNGYDEQGPYIKFGSGNFSVSAEGYITAKGGGTIAGWKITNNFLESQDGMTKLYGTHYWVDDFNNWTRISVGNHFFVGEDGSIKSTAGEIGGWTITSDRLKSYKDNTDKSNDKPSIELTSDGRILGPKVGTNQKGFAIDKDERIWGILADGRAYFTDIKIKNATAPAFKGDEYGSSANVFAWYESSGTNLVPILQLTDNGCQMGGFNISGNQLTSGSFYINSANAGSPNSAVLSAGDAFQIYGNGSIKATGGTIGGCRISGTAIAGGGWSIGSNGLSLDNHGQITPELTELIENVYLVKQVTDRPVPNLKVKIDGTEYPVSGTIRTESVITVGLKKCPAYVLRTPLSWGGSYAEIPGTIRMV